MDEHALFAEYAGAMSLHLDDYATQLERMAARARSLQMSAEDAASVSSYDFFDHYPDIPSVPSEEELYTARTILVDGLAFLLAQISDDLAKMDGYKNESGAYTKIIHFVQGLSDASRNQGGD